MTETPDPDLLREVASAVANHACTHVGSESDADGSIGCSRCDRASRAALAATGRVLGENFDAVRRRCTEECAGAETVEGRLYCEGLEVAWTEVAAAVRHRCGAPVPGGAGSDEG